MGGIKESLKESLKEIWWKLRWSARATSFPHFLAMNMPFNSWRVFFHRLRGVRIGRNVYIVQNAFLEEARPWLITIEDSVRVGPGVLILTHDAACCHHVLDLPNMYAPVVLKKNSTIGAGAMILPGVTVGENAVVAAGALVSKDVPPGMVVAGVPAKPLRPVAEMCAQRAEKAKEYREFEKASHYPRN